MSQNTPASPSLYSAINTTLPSYECRWGWCRLTFPSRNAFVQHVRNEHIYKALPVRRKDISILKRAEEGIGESLGLSSLMRQDGDGSAAIGPRKNTGQQTGNTFSAVLLSQHLSSATPPPLPSSHEIFSPLRTDADNTEAFDHLSGANSTGRSSGHTNSVCNPLNDPIEPPTTPKSSSKHDWEDNHTPTFASLSSPGLEASPLPLPASPTLESLISDAVTGRNRSRGVDTGDKHRRLAYGSNMSQFSSSSYSSSNSFDLVEQHLTQNDNMDIDGQSTENSQSQPILGLNIARTPSPKVAQYLSTYIIHESRDGPEKDEGQSRWPDPSYNEQAQLSPVNKSSITPIAISPSTSGIPSPSEVPLSPVTSANRSVPGQLVQRQAWYQVSRPRHDKSRLSLKQANTKFGDSPGPAGGQSTVEPRLTFGTWSQGESFQTPSQQGDLGSSDYLQTQAPYQSQSLSQT